MTSPIVAAVQASVQIASAAIYVWVARIVLTRTVEGEAKRANTLFGIWWLALGLVSALAAAFTVPSGLFGLHDLALTVTLLNVLILLIAAAIWGLVYYLVYLYTGSARSFWPITAFYVLLAGALLYLIAWLAPTGFDQNGTLTFQRQQLAGAPAIALGLLLSLPVVLAAIAYGSLYFRVDAPVSRYRIALVSGAFLVQFGWSSVSTILQLPQRYPDSPVLPLVSNALGVAAALAVVIAFRPPRRIRERIETATNARSAGSQGSHGKRKLAVVAVFRFFRRQPAGC